MGPSRMARRLTVVVHGTPAPQGSKRHVGHGVLVESSHAVKPWREAVKAATLDELRRRKLDDEAWAPGRLDPVSLDVVFTLTRPAGHYRTGKFAGILKPLHPMHPAGRPDLDKLVRSTFDALTDAGALVDDARVVGLTAAKVYPGGEHLDALDVPGAVITLWGL